MINTLASNGSLMDNFLLGWLAPWPDFCDTPGKDITLVGQTFESPDPLSALTKNKASTVRTGAFQPFGKNGKTTIKGAVKSNGSILRMDADGSNLKLYAWGLRNPFGTMWGPEGRLYAFAATFPRQRRRLAHHEEARR